MGSSARSGGRWLESQAGLGDGCVGVHGERQGGAAHWCALPRPEVRATLGTRCELEGVLGVRQDQRSSFLGSPIR